MNNKRFYEKYDYPEQNFWLEKYLELKKKYNKQEKIIHDQQIIINNIQKKYEIEEKIVPYVGIHPKNTQKNIGKNT